MRFPRATHLKRDTGCLASWKTSAGAPTVTSLTDCAVVVAAYTKANPLSRGTPGVDVTGRGV